MSKGGWARLKKQQHQDAADGACIQVHKSQNKAPSQAHMIQSTDNTTLASTSTSSSLSTASSPSTTSSLSAFSPDPPRSAPIVDQGNSIRAGKLLQIVRRWKARSTASSSAHRSSTNSACSMLNLVPLRCISFPYSDHDDDEEEENEEDVDNQSKGRNSPCEKKVQSTPRRALSCPKLRSPLSSCTPSPMRMYGIDAEEEAEALESLQPKREEGVRRGGMTIRRASSLPLQKQNVSKQASTPKGYLALYVGEERKRFLVKANLVNHPLFSVLLEKAKEEFGFEQQGPLNIPCEIDFFQHIMLLVAESNQKSR